MNDFLHVCEESWIALRSTLFMYGISTSNDHMPRRTFSRLMMVCHNIYTSTLSEKESFHIMAPNLKHLQVKATLLYPVVPSLWWNLIETSSHTFLFTLALTSFMIRSTQTLPRVLRAREASMCIPHGVGMHLKSCVKEETEVKLRRISSPLGIKALSTRNPTVEDVNLLLLLFSKKNNVSKRQWVYPI